MILFIHGAVNAKEPVVEQIRYVIKVSILEDLVIILIVPIHKTDVMNTYF